MRSLIYPSEAGTPIDEESKKDAMSDCSLDLTQAFYLPPKKKTAVGSIFHRFFLIKYQADFKLAYWSISSIIEVVAMHPPYAH